MYLVRTPDLIAKIFPQYQWKVGEKEIALTFDDGPHPESTVKLLELLSEADCIATHFLLGKQVVENLDVTQEILNSQQVVGHHSFSHLNGYRTKNELYLEDITQGYKLIKTNLFRPPYGKIKTSQWRAFQASYPEIKCCMFNFMPGDFDDKVNAELLHKRMQKVKGGDIVVLHDRPSCLEKYQPFLAQWILDKKSQGYSFVGLSA